MINRVGKKTLFIDAMFEALCDKFFKLIIVSCWLLLEYLCIYDPRL